VYEYYTKPNNIQEARPQDIVIVMYSKHAAFFVKNAAIISIRYLSSFLLTSPDPTSISILDATKS
jgi:hypothetical protein